MREMPKCRGKREFDGNISPRKWVYGYYLRNASGVHKIYDTITKGWIPVDPKTVGEFVRSYSLNGETKEIWEGDVYAIEDIKNLIFAVTYDEGTPFFTSTIGGIPWYTVYEILDEDCREITYMGNIIDNPELLETSCDGISKENKNEN